MYTDVANWHCSINVELPTMCLGLSSHHRGCMSRSGITSILLVCYMISQSENKASPNQGVPWTHLPLLNCLMINCTEGFGHLLLSRKAATYGSKG